MRSLLFLALTPLAAVEPPGFGGTAGPGGLDAAAARQRYVATDWHLAWSDDFTMPGRPNPTKWTYEEGLVRNGEAQFYTRDRAENARVEDGHLIITARKEPWQGAGYTSASLTTQGRFALTGGKIEIRAQLPRGRGTWPALWTLGDYDATKGWPEGHWPRCGEIDLVEYVGMEPERFFFTVHTERYNHTKGTQRGHNVHVAEPWKDFHRFGLVWTSERLEWFLDGEPVFAYANDGSGPAAWPFDKPQFLLMNLAIGGGWGGQKGIDDTLFPAVMRVDYVRVWQRP